MAVAHDAVRESHTGTTGVASVASFTWNHVPTGTPRSALVFTFAIGANPATGVTYGGVAMTAVPYTPARAPLWFTLAGTSEDEIQDVLHEILQRTGIPDMDVLDLPTVRKLKVDVRFSFLKDDDREGRDGPA